MWHDSMADDAQLIAWQKLCQKLSGLAEHLKNIPIQRYHCVLTEQISSKF